MPLDSSPAVYAHQGPSLLSQQPLIPSRAAQQEEKDWPTAYLYLERRLSGLRNWRFSWYAHWRDLASFFLPRRVKWWWGPIANQYNRGAEINQNIIDSTGVLAMQTCASGMWSGLTNPTRIWFRFGPALETIQLDQDAKEWLEDLQTRVAAVLHQSNFYSTMAQFFQDVTVFGTSPIIIYEDDEDVIRCYLPCAGEYFLTAGSRLSVDGIYREYTQTVLQMVEMFELENCPPQVQQLFEQGGAALDTEFVVAHSIEPNFPIAGRTRRSKGVQLVSSAYTYREVYWLRGISTPRPLSKRGFNERPFMAGRWYLVSNEPYGRSPCMDGLGDNKQLQVQTLRKGELIEKLVRPPMLADPELKNEPSSIMPGMVTFVNTANAKAGFKPAFEVDAQGLPALTADMDKVSSRLERALFVDVFMAITRMEGVQPRNELELSQRNLERLQLLGPVIDLFENEVASPALQRVVSIMQRRGMVRPMPDSLRGVPLKIGYQSILRMAQESAEAVSLKDFAGAVGVASTGAKASGVPDPARVVDWEEWVRRYGKATHVPSDLMFTPDEVKRHDAARAQAIEQEKAQAAAPIMTKEAVGAAKTLSETELNNGSALDALVGAGSYPG